VDDTDGDDVHVLQWASEFARQQDAELRLIHAVAGTDGMWTQEGDPGMYEFLFHAARERLAKLQAQAGTAFGIELVAGGVGSAVHQAALEARADLIVIGRGGDHKTLGLKSNAYSIIREAPCPVISI
jgi:nucleotide-binding universal stress UspA family protein